MLLKATHAPLIAIVWLYERWEVFRLKRAANALGSNVFGGTSASAAPTSETSPHGHSDSKNAKVTAHKKHSLKKTGRVHVPTALLTSAQLKPSKATGPPQQDKLGTSLGRPATGASNPGTGVPVRVGTAMPITPSPGTQTVNAAGVAELMQMMKDLSTQVEERRIAAETCRTLLAAANCQPPTTHVHFWKWLSCPSTSQGIRNSQVGREGRS